MSLPREAPNTFVMRHRADPLENAGFSRVFQLEPIVLYESA
jgi:hypothetical protein